MAYSAELKEKALKLSDEIGNKAAGEALNVNAKTIAFWRLERSRKLKKEQTDQPTNTESDNKPDENDVETTNEPKYERGQIYYVTKAPQVGSEMMSGRPAIIISNNRVNSKLNSIEVVFLTTRSKCQAPEHIIIHSSNAMSTTICEQITTIDKSRLREYIGTCTPEEMKLIDVALLSSIGLEKYLDADNNEKLLKMEVQLESYKTMLDQLFEKMLTK